MIASGCRWLLLSEALEHWGDGYEGDRRIGDRYVRAIKEFVAETEKEPKA